MKLGDLVKLRDVDDMLVGVVAEVLNKKTVIVHWVGHRKHIESVDILEVIDVKDRSTACR